MADVFNELLNINFEQPSRKREKTYGLKLVKSLWSGFNAGDDAFYKKRNLQWEENDAFAKGQVNTTDIFRSLGVQNDKSYINYDLKALLRIVPRYMQGILGGFMNREEKPSVDATDILSRQMKEERKARSVYLLKNKQQIAAMQQASGQELEPDTPDFEDMDELDMYYKVEDRLPEESIFEETIWEVFQNSSYETLKRQILSDLVRNNFAATKRLTQNGEGRTLGNRVKIRHCRPRRCVYNIFESPVGDDVSLFGEVYPLTISDIRKSFPSVDEQTLYDIAKKAASTQNILNFTSWQPTYYDATVRPYDDYKIPVFDFEVKVADKDYYVKTENSFGNDIVIKKKGKPNPQNGEVLEENKFNIYCGTWVVGTDIMLNWDMAPNQIRAYQNGVDCFFNYSVVIPDNDGTLIPSLLERGISCVREMVRCALKIQQMMITMKPDDVSIDVAGLRDLDIGTGDTLKPIEVTKIYDETGRIYWDSTDVTGTNGEGNRIPFAQIPNSGNAAQINTLVGLYNFWLARLNDEWGTNPDAMGQPVPARRSNGVNQQMVQASNQATEYVYDHFVELMKMNASKVAMTLWDIMVLESVEYKGMDGTDPALINAKFDVNMDMIPVNENRQWLEQLIQVSIERQSITPGQAIRIRNMDNVKEAELYLIRLEKKQAKDAAASQQANVQMNAQVQQQSLQAKAQADASVKEREAQVEAILSKSKTQDAAFLELVKMCTALQVDSQANGLPISDDNMALIKAITDGILAKKNEQEQAEAEQQQAAAQQQQQQQGAAPQDQEQAEQQQGAA